MNMLHIGRSSISVCLSNKDQRGVDLLRLLIEALGAQRGFDSLSQFSEGARVNVWPRFRAAIGCAKGHSGGPKDHRRSGG